MSFESPMHSRKQVERAGEVLRQSPPNVEELAKAMPVISNWRSSHAYLLNTFQATLRKKLKSLGLDAKQAPVGQRLKRLPSIEQKLRRFDNMSLARMQDIAGLRAVLPSRTALAKIKDSYVHSTRFPHELRYIHDYVQTPKEDGYRSIHLIYRYQNARAPAYNGLHLELQLRTKLQHAWATAVETVDTFANSAIKAGRPSARWREFFQLASAAFAQIEGMPVPQQYQKWTHDQVCERLRDVEQELDVLMRLRGFSVAADKIHRRGGTSASYHVVILNTERYVLWIESYPERELEAATVAYAEAEARTALGEPIDAILVAGGSVEQLRKTYPNYFMDASTFVRQVSKLCGMSVRPGVPPKRRRPIE